MNKERLSQLSFEEKKKLLEKMGARKVNPQKNSNVVSIPRFSRDKPIPASVIQQEIWFHESLVKNSNAYNIPIALEIYGDLNYSALVQAFRVVIDRYEILRTSFYTIGGIPFQKVLDHLDFNLDVIDLKNLSGDLKEKTWMDLLFRFSKKSFDLDKAPLFRVLCIELTPTSRVLSFVMHHLLCDNWSLTLLIQEILTLFNQISKGEQIEYLVPSFQYGDYAFWEKEMLSTEETKSKMEALKSKLQSLHFELKLPYDRPRNFHERAEAKSKQFLLDSDSPEKIKNMCQRTGITPYIFFLTIYHALLYKYTFQSNIVIGTSFLNRPTNDEEKLMGPFINVALIDSNISPDTTFIALANQIKKSVLEMHSLRFIPLNKMIKSINTLARKDLSLTQVFFGFLNFKINQVSTPSSQDLTVKLLNQSNELRVYNSAKFELDLTLWEDEQNMGGSLEYMSNVFNEETIDLLMDHYKQLCQYMADQPNLKLQEIKLNNPLSSSKSILEEETPFIFG